MKTAYKVLPAVILAVTSAGAFWLSTGSARADILPVLSNYTPEEVARLIQSWGQTILLGLGTLTSLIIVAIGYAQSIRRKLSERIDERAVVQQVHHEQIAEINQRLTAPVPSIPTPEEAAAKPVGSMSSASLIAPKPRTQDALALLIMFGTAAFIVATLAACAWLP